MFTARNVLVALVVLLMTASGIMDLLQPPPLVEGFAAIGLPIPLLLVVAASTLDRRHLAAQAPV